MMPGEILELRRTQNPTDWQIVQRTYVEGGVGQILPLAAGTGLVYASGHGYLKKFTYGSPGHTNDPADVGEYLGATVPLLGRLGATGPNGASFAALIKDNGWRLALLDDSLSEVGQIMACSGSAPRILKVLDSSPQQVDLLASWNVLPNVAGTERPGLTLIYPFARPHEYIDAPKQGPPTSPLTTSSFRDDLIRLLLALYDPNENNDLPPPNSDDPASDLDTSLDDLGIGFSSAGTNSPGCDIPDSARRTVVLPARASSMTKVPTGTPLPAIDTETGRPFNARWIVTTTQGQVILLGGLQEGPIYQQTLNEALASSFGIDKIDEMTVLAMGPLGKGFEIDVATGQRSSRGQERHAEFISSRRLPW